MKKHLQYFLFLIFLCSGLSAKQVDPETASSIAKSFISGNTNLRTSSSPDLKLVYTSGNKIRTSRTTKKTISYYYIFNIGNNQGFIIVSADDVNSPILGYSTNGNYNRNNLPDNFKSWMRTIEMGMEEAISKRKSPSIEIQTEWGNFKSGKSIYSKSTRAVVVVPLIKTKWAQRDPYNSEIPYDVATGCVATATAQIMKYHNHPISGTGTTEAYTLNNDNTVYSIPSINLSKYTYDWKNMTNSYSSTASEAQKKAVGLLMYHIGASIKMNYSKIESSAQSRNAAKALFTHFNYDKNLEFRERYDYISDENNNSWDNMLRNELNNKRPIYYDGYGKSGHAFICDGYDDQGFFHFNWGWGGYQDGYFKTTATLDYKNGQNVIINIKPNEGGTAIVKLELNKDFTSISSTITSAKKYTKFSTSFSFKNVSLVPFEGYYGVALTDNSNNIKYILDQSDLSELQPGYFFKEYNFNNCIIPLKAIAGKYKLKMVAKLKNETNWFIVTNPSSSVINHIPFEILDETAPHNIEITDNTPFTSNKSLVKKGETLKVMLSFKNYSFYDFMGKIGLALIDESNKIKHIINTESKYTNLSPDQSYNNYEFNNCVIPIETLPGKYKIKMIIQSSFESNWTIVTSSFATISDSYIIEIKDASISPKLELLKNIFSERTSGKRGLKFTTNLSFKNISLIPFEGYYGVALTDNSDNIKYILDQSKLAQLNSGYYYPSYSFKNCFIPMDAISGKYNLRMIAKYKDDTNWFIVTNPSSSIINHIPFEILDGSEPAKLQVYGTTPITVSENPATTGETLAVKLSFVNFSGIPFKGYYGIALTDDSSNIKYILEQSILSQLSQNNYFPEYNFYNCIIPQNALPGKYKLRMVSKIEGENDWVIVTSPTSSIIDQIAFEIISATRLLPTSLKTSIYPNPATNYLQIQSTEKINKILVYNLSGNIVLQANGNNSNNTISVANLNPGMYIVHIHTENGITKQNLIKE